MAEKIIGEIRFVETDDGFRVEVKGDKERLRKMGFGPGTGFGPGMGYGPRVDFGPGMHGRGRGWRHGHWKHGPFGGFGPWMWGWGCWGDDSEDAFDTEKKPPKDA